METTFTDIVIAAFKHHDVAQANIDSSKEAETGADLELLILGPHKQAVVFVIQAKRSEPSSPGSDNFSFKHIFHKAPRAKLSQVEQLAMYCKSQNTKRVPYLGFDAFYIPLYAFYHGRTAASSLGCSGIMVNKIERIISEGKKTGNKNRKCVFHQEGAFPFHELFCKVRNNGLYSLSKSLTKGLEIGNARQHTPGAFELRNQWLRFETGDSPASCSRALLDLSCL